MCLLDVSRNVDKAQRQRQLQEDESADDQISTPRVSSHPSVQPSREERTSAPSSQATTSPFPSTQGKSNVPCWACT